MKSEKYNNNIYYFKGGGDIRPGAWREAREGGSDSGRSSFRDRGSDRERDSGPREWSHDRDRGSGFGPRRNYGDSDRERNNGTLILLNKI